VNRGKQIELLIPLSPVFRTSRGFCFPHKVNEYLLACKKTFGQLLNSFSVQKRNLSIIQFTTMKKFLLPNALIIAVLSLSLSGCSVVGDIFQAGMWVGIIGIALLVLLVLWIFRKFR